MHPAKDETPQTFSLSGSEVTRIMLALAVAPEKIKKAFRRESVRTYDFSGATQALTSQIRGMVTSACEEVSSYTLPRRLWVACYHAMIWDAEFKVRGSTYEKDRDLRFKITRECV